MATTSQSSQSSQPASAKLIEVPLAIGSKYQLKPIFRGFRRPVAVEAVPGTDKLLVVEQRGEVKLVDLSDPKKAPRQVFSISGLASGNEQGLLGLALGPNKKYVYLSYTISDGTTRITGHELADDLTIAKKVSRDIFKLEQPYGNHNGGTIMFHKGRLWLGLGDGGGAGDPVNAGQRLDTPLAKMLSFDVNAADPTPKTEHVGLRNPWKYDFDPANGDMYIADVGQNKWEYIYAVNAESLTKVINFGWNVVEGSHCFRSQSCDASKFWPPVVEYSHNEGLSITGGIVYRGKAFPRLAGHYFYADFVTGLLRSFKLDNSRVAEHWDWRKALDPQNKITQVSTFGRTLAGEMLVVTLTGDIYQLLPKN